MVLKATHKVNLDTMYFGNDMKKYLAENNISYNIVAKEDMANGPGEVFAEIEYKGSYKALEKMIIEVWEDDLTDSINLI